MIKKRRTKKYEYEVKKWSIESNEWEEKNKKRWIIRAKNKSKTRKDEWEEKCKKRWTRREEQENRIRSE